MIRYLTIPLIALVFVLSGCYTLDATTSCENGEHHIVVSNFGWRLFYGIPLCCGNARNAGPYHAPWVLFRDDVKMDIIQKRFMEYAAQFDGEVGDLTYVNKESVLFNVPFTQIPFPIPYIFCYREIQLSGVVR